MKKIVLILYVFFSFIFSFADENENIDYGIDLIRNRTGENKAGQYFKNFDKEKTVLFLDGFWDMEFLGLSSFEFFSSYAKVNSFQAVFKQKANLSLWLLLNKSFYFETLYKDDYIKSSLAFGYLGKENSPIKHIRAGNSNIKFPLNYGYVNTGGGKFISPGIMGTFAGKNWQADTVLRYESSEYNSKIYYGNSEVVENKISLNAWQKARHFYIPIEKLYGAQIFVFVKDFEGGQWRYLSQDEFSVDIRLKVLSLKKSYPEGVAVNYFDLEDDPSDMHNLANKYLADIQTYFSSLAGIPAFSDILDFINNHVTINSYKKNIFGKDYLVLKEKNFSPFEIASRYQAPQAEANSSPIIIDANNQTESSSFTASIETTDNFLSDFQKIKFIQVLNSNNNYDFSKPQQAFPFLRTDYKIYIPNNLEESNLNFQILCKTYTSSPDFILPDAAIPGSIRVFKNKIRVFDFEYNDSNHILTMYEPVFSNDIVEIQWKEGLDYSDSGLVRFAGGGRWLPFNNLELFLAGSGDWEIAKQKTNPIDVYKLSGGIDYKNKNIKTGSIFGFEAEAERTKKPKEQTYIFKNKSYFNYVLKGELVSKNEVPIISNPSFHFEENFEAGINTININIRTKASLDIWKIKLAGSLSLKNNFLTYSSSSKIIESYGHSVIMPIYFFTAAEDFFVNRYDKILRRESKLNFQKYVDINYLTAIDYNKDYTSQKTNVSLSPIIPTADFGVIYTQLNFFINQKYKTLFDPSESSYHSVWTKSLVDMYSKGEKTAEDRSGGINFLLNYFPNNKEDAGISISGFNFEAFSKTGFKNKISKQSIDETGFEISIPFSKGYMFFSPIIKRKITREKRGCEAELQASYASDLSSLFSGMGLQYWLFSKPFLYDMFDQKINSQIQTSNKDLSYFFLNSYGFNFSRLISGSIKDIYIPLEAGVSLSRLVQSAQINSPVNIYSIDFLFKYITLNIWGKYGYFDLFKFYEQDELNSLYKFGFSFGENYFKFKFNSIHSLYFFFTSNDKLGIENELLCTASKIGAGKLTTDEWKEKFSFVFLYTGGGSLPRLIIESFSKIQLLDKREERLSLEFSQSKEMRKLNYKLSFKHSQSTKIGEHGEVKIFAELEGLSTSVNSFLLNINAGISGKIDF